MTKKPYIYLCVTVLVFLIACYITCYTVILSRIHENLYDAGFETVAIDGFGLYADGFVLKQATLDETITLKSAYIQAYPWQWLSHTHRRFYIQELHADISNHADKPIVWPFVVSDIINIEKINIKAPVLDNVIIFSGSIRKPSDSPFIFNLKSENTDMQVDMRAEIHATDGIVHVLDIELQDATIQKPTIQAKRMFGWLSFSWDKTWQVIGEIESGFLTYEPLTAFNNNVKLNGPIDKIDFSFAAHRAQDEQSFILDREDDHVIVRSYDEQDRIEWTGLSEDFVAQLKEILDQHSTRNDDAEYLRTALDAARHKTRPVLSDEQIVKSKENAVIQKKTDVIVQTETVESKKEESTSLVVEDRIIPKITFNSLIENTLFAGFYYTRSLAVIPHSCSNGVHDCWTARAQGGHLGYGIDGVTPRYFAQIKNIDEARILRNALRDVAVERLTLKGKGNVTEKIILQGTSGNDPVYIELAISDLE